MWYILNFIPRPGFRRSALPGLIGSFNETLDRPIELFAPTFVSITADEGQVKKRSKPLLYHYIFVRGDEEDIKRLCLSFEGFSFVMDRTGRSRHLSVSDDTMAQFRIIAEYYSGKLPCYPLDSINLEEGDRVQVVSGPCAGLTGTYVSRRGGHSGNILIAVDTSLAAVVYDIKADYVRVLEFARDSRRLYDQLDAFVARITPLLAESSSGAAGDQHAQRSLSALSAATVFTRRLGVVKVSNPKLNAKLQILLYAAYSILSDAAGATEALEKYRNLSSHVTNPKTQALVTSILSSLPCADSQGGDSSPLRGDRGGTGGTEGG